MENVKPIWWQELSWPEVAELVKKTDTALLPIGSIEQHGRHLPLGVDVYIPMGIAERVSILTGVPILPPICYAPCSWHQGFPGTINVSSETLIKLIVEICLSVRKIGIKHIIGINGHTGGCDSSLIIAADTVLEKEDVRFWIVDVVDIARKDIIDVCNSPVLGHADEIETSEMMAIRPDLVHIEGINACNRQPKSDLLSINYRTLAAQMHYRMNQEDWKCIAPEGYIGDPSSATSAKGERMISSIVKNIEGFIIELNKWQGIIE